MAFATETYYWKHLNKILFCVLIRWNVKNKISKHTTRYMWNICVVDEEQCFELRPYFRDPVMHTNTRVQRTTTKSLLWLRIRITVTHTELSVLRELIWDYGKKLKLEFRPIVLVPQIMLMKPLKTIRIDQVFCFGSFVVIFTNSVVKLVFIG